MRERKKHNYINNADFYTEMVIYITQYREFEAGKRDRPQLSNYIGECFMLIAKKLTNHGWFSGYSFKEDMIGDAYFICVRYAHNFNPDKYNNPFAYFTQISWFAFRGRINKEKKQLYIKLKNLEYSYIMDELIAEGVYGEDHAIELVDIDYDKTSQFITDYEKGLTAKREKSKIANQKKQKEPSRG